MAPVAVLIAETTNKAEGGSSSRAQTMNQISYKTRESWLEGGNTGMACGATRLRAPDCAARAIHTPKHSGADTYLAGRAV